MIKKLLNFINFLLSNKISFKFSSPIPKNIVIFDGESSQDLEYLLDNYDYKVVENRKERIREIYCSLRFTLKFFMNFISISKKINLNTIYLYTLIESINPKFAITSIDNSLKFSLLAKLFEKKIKFIAIQNASRLDFAINSYLYKKKKTQDNNKSFYIPNYFCFGKVEEKDCQKYNIKVDKFYNVGSIRVANFFEYLKNNKIKLNKNKYDICLISEPAKFYNKNMSVDNAEKGFAETVRYTIEFSRKNNLKFIFAGKRITSSEKNYFEMKFYREHLSNDNFNYLVNNMVLKTAENKYSSYSAIFESKVAIGTASTLLKDKIGCGEKILSCNLTNFDLLNFPIEGICSINNCSYNQFEERIEKILKIDIDDYFNNNSLHQDYVMNFDKNISVLEKIKKTFKNFEN